MNWLAIAMLMLLSIDAAAQTIKGDWRRVQNLPPGSRVRVIAGDGARLNGSIVAASADSLTIMVKRQSRSLPIEDVTRVQTQSRTQQLLLGAILVPVGMLAGWLVCPYCANEGHGHDLMLLGAAAGAAGWLVPVYVTIYEVPAYITWCHAVGEKTDEQGVDSVSGARLSDQFVHGEEVPQASQLRRPRWSRREDDCESAGNDHEGVYGVDEYIYQPRHTPAECHCVGEAVPRDQWRSLRMEDQVDAILYLGSPSEITYSKLSPALCADTAYVAMRLRRLAVAGGLALYIGFLPVPRLMVWLGSSI